MNIANIGGPGALPALSGIPIDVLRGDGTFGPVTGEAKPWVPVDGSGAGLTISYTADSCFYLELGRLVFAFFSVVYPATANASQARITGLPFNSKATTGIVGGGFITFTDVTASHLTTPVTVGANNFRFNVKASPQTNANMTGGSVAGCVIYPR